MLNCKLTFSIPFAIFVILFFCRRAYSYAEIHYTFFRYSIINRGYPEILFDAPWRINPGEPIPIGCIIKDADKFPVKVNRIIARYSFAGGKTQEKKLLGQGKFLRISDHYWYMLSFLELPQGEYGNLTVNLEMEIVRNRLIRKIINDNFPGLTHSPLKIFISPYNLPNLDGWYAGDSHYHSDMTQDQIEFGAPVQLAAAMGISMGLSWLVATDHSYDLDIVINDFYQHDPKLPRWHKVHEDSALANSENEDFLVIPAEEISCGNCKSRNIHLLAFNTPDFIPGKGDGVKRGLNKRPDLTLRQCINRIANNGGFAYAAHPEDGNGYLGTLFLNRDHWRDRDYAQGGYAGLQFWNGKQGKAYDKAYDKWIRLLLEGRKLYILGGNDAHGDFNRSRRVIYPNTKISEYDEHVFGRVRTHAFCGDNLSIDGVMDALKNGRTTVTDGPLVIMQLRNNENGQIANIGEEIIGRDFTLIIKGCSSQEFGAIEKINLHYGDLLTKTEQIDQVFKPEKFNGKSAYDYTLSYDLPEKNKGYFRLEAMSSARGKEYKCITNPIWFRSV